MPRENSPSGLPTGEGTILDICGGDVEKARLMQRLVLEDGWDYIKWLGRPHIAEWIRSVEGTLSAEAFQAEVAARMPEAVRESVLRQRAWYARVYGAEAEEGARR